MYQKVCDIASAVSDPQCHPGQRSLLLSIGCQSLEWYSNGETHDTERRVVNAVALMMYRIDVLGKDNSGLVEKVIIYLF